MKHSYRFKVNKLIRDKMPAILRAKDIRFVIRTMDTGEYIRRLKDKLVEEAEEIQVAKTHAELIEEVADLMEVMAELKVALRLDEQEITQARFLKREQKGGFEERTYNEYIEMDADNQMMNYYLERADKYPEIK